MLKECEKWWSAANDRRQHLILLKYKHAPLTKEEGRELEILQRLADDVINNDDLFQPND